MSTLSFCKVQYSQDLTSVTMVAKISVCACGGQDRRCRPSYREGIQRQPVGGGFNSRLALQSWASVLGCLLPDTSQWPGSLFCWIGKCRRPSSSSKFLLLPNLLFPQLSTRRHCVHALDKHAPLQCPQTVIVLSALAPTQLLSPDSPQHL